MPQSVQCPRCNGAVSVAENAAGARVKCPHCDQSFLAPGIAKSTNDDDDWLVLDDSPVSFSSEPGPTSPPTPPTTGSAPAPPPTGSAPTSPRGSTPPDAPAPGPTLSADDEALLSEFTSDLDDFTAEVEAPPAPIPMSAAAGGAPTTPSGTSTEKAAEEIEYATEYRVTCNICGSFLYARANQAGKTVKCSDCHSPITVPSPPRVRKKSKVNVDDAETFTFNESKKVVPRADPYQKSAKDLLDEASRVEVKKPTPVYDDTPSVGEWAKNVFGIFTDLGVLVHWVGLTVLAAVPAAIAISLESDILMLGLFPAGFFLGVLAVGCGFAILQSVANEESTVSDWPTLDPFSWLGQLFVVVAAASLAAVPAMAICTIMMAPPLLTAAITMFSVYVVLPFVLLSMLDMNSVFVPFSPEVARSVTKCEEAWGGFYFSSGLLFVGLFLLFASTGWMSPVTGATVSIAAGIGVTFAYFSMIGRLAYSIGQAVNAPPMENDIDRTRHIDT